METKKYQLVFEIETFKSDDVMDEYLANIRELIEDGSINEDLHLIKGETVSAAYLIRFNKALQELFYNSIDQSTSDDPPSSIRS